MNNIVWGFLDVKLVCGMKWKKYKWIDIYELLDEEMKIWYLIDDGKIVDEWLVI